jgi:hypothetical protein
MGMHGTAVGVGGIGLVWGWLVGQRAALLLPRTLHIGVLTAATALVATEVLLFSGQSSCGFFVAATVLSLTIESLWFRKLGRT